MEHDAAGQNGHTYRVCEIVRGPTERKGAGRPKRVTLLEFRNVSDSDLVVMRKHHEASLKPTQYAELNGKMVARGSQITPADEQADMIGPVNAEQEGASFHNQLLWEVHQRASDAQADLRDQWKAFFLDMQNQIKALNAQALQQVAAFEARAMENAEKMNARAFEQASNLHKMLDEILKLKIEMLRTPVQGPSAIDIEALTKLVGAGFEMYGEYQKKGK